MTTIIFAVVKPKTDTYADNQRWDGCITNLAALAGKDKNIQLLGANVLLIQLDHDLNGIAVVIREILELPYRYTILNEELKWIEVANKA
jgi:hypothetical protein